MAVKNQAADTNGEIEAEPQDTGTETGFKDVKNIIADTLHTVAEVIGQKAAEQDGQPGIARCGEQAAAWLDQSAEYVRHFDYDQADASVREYVGQNPGRNLLIAGGVGLIIGAVLRRK